MEWLRETLLGNSPVQAVIIISLICALGLALAKTLRWRGVSLGVTYVFFIGILFGAMGDYAHPGDPLVNKDMLDYAESFGLVLFVYALGLKVGPGFFQSFRQGGTRLNLFALLCVGLGTLLALCPVLLAAMPLPDMMGVLSGATTNTPALGAAQQALKSLGLEADATTAALACALTYPIGAVGVILALLLVRRPLERRSRTYQEAETTEEAFITAFEVTNPAIVGHTLGDVAEMDGGRFTVTRLWRDGKVLLPQADTELQQGDRLMVITDRSQLGALTIFFGHRDQKDWNKEDIDWNRLDDKLISERIVVTKSAINGRRLRDLRLRTRYGVNVSRVKRAGMHLVARPGLVLLFGDRLTVVGPREGVKQVADQLGNAVGSLDTPNLVAIFLGIVLGLLLGAVPFYIPGMSAPVRLGLAGGPIVMGIVVGAFGPRLHMVTYTTSSANQILRSLGLSMYLGCLGLDAGADFLATAASPSALVWLGWGAVITLVPVMLTAVLCVVFGKRGYAATAGMLCGAMANPIALDFVSDTTKGDKATVAYATVYPLAMFVRVIIAQVVVLMWFA
ncbi:MAG: putative transporter [Bacteroidaceae bacterium]|nr:putative transporter [Bacteroidaceae bacterium]